MVYSQVYDNCIENIKSDQHKTVIIERLSFNLNCICYYFIFASSNIIRNVTTYPPTYHQKKINSVKPESLLN